MKTARPNQEWRDHRSALFVSWWFLKTACAAEEKGKGGRKGGKEGECFV